MFCLFHPGFGLPFFFFNLTCLAFLFPHFMFFMGFMCMSVYVCIYLPVGTCFFLVLFFLLLRRPPPFTLLYSVLFCFLIGLRVF